MSIDFLQHVRRDFGLASVTTYGVGGKADLFFQPETTAELCEIVGQLIMVGLPYYILGLGSNVLVSDSGYRGAVITTKLISEYEIRGNLLSADCGCCLAQLAHLACENSLSGLEWASGIPSTVGGAVMGNAGAFGGNMSQIVRSVTVLIGGEIVTLTPSECEFGYRTSGITSIILAASLELTYNKSSIIKLRGDKFRIERNLRQPQGKCAGSVFKNIANSVKGSDSTEMASSSASTDSPLASAGELIERAGLKNCRIGGAVVSTQHANFIMNDANATAEDIYHLIQHVKSEVYKVSGIDLVEEIKYLGEF